MKLSVKAQNPLEWIAIRLKLLPEPLAHGMLYFVLSRAVLEANHLGIFRALDKEGMSLPALAKKLNLNELALRSLITCLAPAGYFDYDGKTLSLSSMSRKWMSPSSKDSLEVQLELNLITWPWMDHLGEFLRTGKGVQYHDTFTSAEWEVYQKAMGTASGNQAKEVAKKLPVPAHATAMLDIGGSHGRFSVEVCRRHPGLSSTVLDLPQAIEHAAPLLAKEGMGDRVKHLAGDALKDVLGENKYDFILCSNLMHHFTQEENLDLTRRAARALKPGGCFAILEFLRPPINKKGDQIGAIMDLYFAISSSAGTWSIDEMKSWHSKAGLKPGKVVRFLSLPGFGCVLGQKA